IKEVAKITNGILINGPRHEQVSHDSITRKRSNYNLNEYTEESNDNNLSDHKI
ncbi:hypothetical protein PFDG_05363, partial [Plasmodium falciparum Dd2]